MEGHLLSFAITRAILGQGRGARQVGNVHPAFFTNPTNPKRKKRRSNGIQVDDESFHPSNLSPSLPSLFTYLPGGKERKAAVTNAMAEQALCPLTHYPTDPLNPTIQYPMPTLQSSPHPPSLPPSGSWYSLLKSQRSTGQLRTSRDPYIDMHLP